MQSETGVKNCVTIMDILAPVKFRRGICKMFEWIYQDQPIYQHLICLAGDRLASSDTRNLELKRKDRIPAKYTVNHKKVAVHLRS